ncbi:MAG: hypothetical protein ABII90_09010 [Bacteroidota bacterium]
MINYYNFLLNRYCPFLTNPQGFKNPEGLAESLDEILSKKLSHQFGNLFNSYTKAFNKQNNRKGPLFYPNFKRKQITTERYLRKLIIYIHRNPIEHEFASKINEWRFSSYNTLVSNKPTMLKREQVIEWFDDLDNFKFCHQKPLDEEFISDIEKNI